ncbi:MAG: hypothetical protein J6F31_04230 [Oscillospiraceae bacterium]|nr:hypothetical protein [Oscillospiraceae bacterium]
MDYKIRRAHIGPARFSVDLGDGSERGEYVDQDYILHSLGRPHRAVSLMYCYYPYDKEWPGRISEVMKDADVAFQWDYPYDDYFTYGGGLRATGAEPFEQMRDIRRHGQDVNLTLTIDPNCTDDHLIAIAKDLKPFGRMYLRINHEATGNWFSFTKRASYKEVGDFFVHFTDIIHEYAPNVKTVMCIGGIEDLNETEMIMEEEFKAVVPSADIWSVDKYMALHWGWPFDVATKETNQYSRSNVAETYEKTKRSYERFRFLNGGKGKPMTMAEFNADGDVTGAYDQAEMVKEFCALMSADKEDWFTGFTFYQFRDRGRLGLEIEDPNNPDVGIPQPVMDTYREIIHSKDFSPVISLSDEVSFPVKMRWGASDDSDGVAMTVHFEGDPHFCELSFEDEGSYMIKINDRWFYRAPGVKTVDLMSAFYGRHIDASCDMDIVIFATPSTGENDPSQGEGWDTDYISTMEKLPSLRVEFEPVVKRV